jgi:hypothetical protein
MPGTDRSAALCESCTWVAVLLAACGTAGVHPDAQDAALGGEDAGLGGAAADAGGAPHDPDAAGPAAGADAANVDASMATAGPGREAGSSGGPVPADAGAANDAGAGNGKPDADAAGDAASSMVAACDRPGLVWKSAKKTNYESYPAPGSDECVKFNGCAYLGQFQACENTMPESWVKSHDIAAVFPLQGLELHNLCLRAGARTIVVTAIDTCGDGDCGGCCTKNRGTADRLIDLEKYTNQRFGVADGELEWADLGAADHGFDGCNAR